MSKTITAKKTPAKKTPPQPLLVVTGKNAFGWLFSLFVVCGCMFVIGVLVGRGQSPVQFDTHGWEEDLNNLKMSVLAKQEEFRDAMENIEVIDFLKEKGRSIQFYKQYIPPLLSPKYGKTPPPAETRPVAGESPLAEQPDERKIAAVTTEQTAPPPFAPEKMEPPQAASSPDMDVISAEGFAMDDPELPEMMDVDVAAVQEPIGGTAEAYVQQAAPAESIPEDPAALPPAADAAIAVKKPATSKPATIRPLPAPVAEDTYIMAQAPPPPEQETVMALAPDAAETSRQTTATPAPTVQYAIQVASLREMDKANAVRDKFRTKGYPAYCQSSEIRGVTWHRVRIGPYPDRGTADQDYRRLKEVGVDALVFLLEP